MALRLAGETPGVVQGLDGQGWPQMASPGSIDLRVGLLHRPRTGAYILHPYHANGYDTGVTAGLAADSLRAIVPIDIPERWVFEGIGIYITVAGDTGAEVRLGLYRDDGSGVYPGALVFDAGYVPADSTGEKTITLSPTVAVGPGRYYLAHLSKSVATMPQCKFSSDYMMLLGSSNLYQPQAYNEVYKTYTYAALPDPYPSGGLLNAGYLLRIGFKLASIG